MDWKVLADLRGGRNGVDSPIDPLFPDNQAVECFNIDYEDGAPLGRKRGGVASLSLSGGTAFTGAIHSLGRHVPAGDETAAEFFAVDSAAVPIWKRLAGGATWANVAVADAIQTVGMEGVNFVTFNGKLFIFYDSTVDRSHVWDGTNLRRVSFADPQQAPTVANQGAGAYAATLRYYRVRWLHLSGNTIIRRSEPTDSVAFTPSGAGASARVTIPPAPNDGETHWELEASTDNVAWNVYRGYAEARTEIAVATTFYDDSAAISLIATRAISNLLGYYTPFSSFKFGISDDNRMLMAGSYEGGKGSRIYHTPVLGSGLADDERLADFAGRKPYTDISEKNGGDITGLGGPIHGIVFAFKYRQIWQGTPTGDVDVPYKWRCISRTIGAINHKSIVLGQDAQGRPCIYFLSYQGPHRIGVNGIEYLGRDIEDIWHGFNGFSGINLDATVTPGHGVYHGDAGRVEWCIATGGANTPDIKIVLYVKQATRVDRYGVRGGWVYHTLDTAARCSCMFSTDIGSSMSRKLSPYLGRTNATVGKTDHDSSLDDIGVDFQSYIQTKSLVPPSQLGQQIGILESILMARYSPGLSVRQTLIYDFGLGSQTADVTLTADGAETRVIRKFTGGGMSDMGVVQVRLGDSAAQEGQWLFEALLLPIIEERDK